MVGSELNSETSRKLSRDTTYLHNFILSDVYIPMNPRVKVRCLSRCCCDDRLLVNLQTSTIYTTRDLPIQANHSIASIAKGMEMVRHKQ